MLDGPFYASFDYVEVYNYEETSKEFTLEWRDDFDELDLKRWI